MAERSTRVEKIPKREASAKEVLATLCYFYPQYTLRQARQLPYRDVVLLLKTAKRMKAQEYHQLTQIAAAPHTKKGAGVNKLLAAYAKEAKVG